MGKGGYSKEEQPDKGAPIFKISTIADSGNPPEFQEGNALKAPPEGTENNGDNPSMPSSLPFAGGKDNRVGH